MEVEELIALIKPPFVAIKVGGEIACTDSRLAVKCGRAHIHTYNHNDIVSRGGSLLCPTCTVKGAENNMLLAYLESAFARPFVVSESKSPVIFLNPVIRLRVSMPVGGITKKTIDGEWIDIQLYRSKNKKKISRALCAMLSDTRIAREYPAALATLRADAGFRYDLVVEVHELGQLDRNLFFEDC